MLANIIDITAIRQVIKNTKLTKSAKFSIIHALKFQKTWGQDLNSKNYLKLTFSLIFEDFSIYRPKLQSNIKTIGHANICDHSMQRGINLPQENYPLPVIGPALPPWKWKLSDLLLIEQPPPRSENKNFLVSP